IMHGRGPKSRAFGLSAVLGETAGQKMLLKLSCGRIEPLVRFWRFTQQRQRNHAEGSPFNDGVMSMISRFADGRGAEPLHEILPANARKGIANLFPLALGEAIKHSVVTQRDSFQ